MKCFKQVCLFTLFLMLIFNFYGCSKEPERFIEYVTIEKPVIVSEETVVEVPVEIIKEVLVEVPVVEEKVVTRRCCSCPQITYQTNFVDGVEILCNSCFSTWGTLPMDILPKDYVEIIVEKEVITEKLVEVFVEKEVIIESSEFVCLTADSVLSLSEGDVLDNVLITNDSTFAKYPLTATGSSEYEGFNGVTIKYEYRGWGEWETYVVTKDIYYQDIGVLNGTIKRIESTSDDLGNTSITVILYDDFSVHKITDFISPSLVSTFK